MNILKYRMVRFEFLKLSYSQYNNTQCGLYMADRNNFSGTNILDATEARHTS